MQATCPACFVPQLYALRSGTARWGAVVLGSPAIELRSRRRPAALPGGAGDDPGRREGQRGGGRPVLATKISGKGNYKLLYDLTRNQLLLDSFGASPGQRLTPPSP